MPLSLRFDDPAPEDAEVIVQRQAELLTRQAGRRGFAAQAQTALAEARAIGEVSVVGPGGLDPLAERRTTLLQRIVLGQAAVEAHRRGQKLVDLAAEARCTDTWMRNLMLLGSLPEDIQAEIRRPRSLAPALSDRQLRAIARHRADPAAARALFDRLLGQVSAFVQRGAASPRPKPQRLARRGLAPVFEQARAWARLLESGEARSARDLAKKAGVSNVTISTYLDLLKLEPALQRALDQHRPPRVPVALKALQRVARLPPEAQRDAFEAAWPGLLPPALARSA